MKVLNPNASITRTVYKDSQLSLVLFIPPPEAIEGKSKYQVNYTSILYLQLNGGVTITLEELKTRRFAIKPSNLYDVLLFFDEIMSWFREKEDLFLESDTGELVFNSKYNDLKTFTRKRYFDNCIMKAIPAVIEVGQGVFKEGIYLFINKKDNFVHLVKDQIDTLFNVLRTFNFATETSLTLALLNRCAVTGAIKTQNDFDKIHQYNGFQPK